MTNSGQLMFAINDNSDTRQNQGFLGQIIWENKVNASITANVATTMSVYLAVGPTT